MYIYEDPRVGASGASVWTGVSCASSVITMVCSASPSNVCHGYRIKSLEPATKKSRTTALEAALQKAGLEMSQVLQKIPTDNSSTPFTLVEKASGEEKEDKTDGNKAFATGSARSGTRNTSATKQGVQFYDTHGDK